MRKLVSTSIAAAALAAALSGVASAQTELMQTHPVWSAAHTSVGTTTQTPAASNDARPDIGIVHVTAPSQNRRDDFGSGRTWHPDYSHALTPEQMQSVRNAEVERVFEFTPAGTGGG